MLVILLINSQTTEVLVNYTIAQQKFDESCHLLIDGDSFHVLSQL